VLHQVGVSFDLYYDARKHKINNISVTVFTADRKKINFGSLAVSQTLHQHIRKSVSQFQT